MKVYNTYYLDVNTLKAFLKVNNIQNTKQILIQVFTGICEENYINDLLKNLLTLLPDAKIIGSTTDGEILDANVSSSKTVLSISVFEETKIFTYFTDEETNSTKTASALISQLEKDKLGDDLKLFITFADGIHTNGQEYIEAFESYNKSLIIAGGLAGDNAKFKETYIFTQDGVLKNGAVAAALCNPNLIVNSNYDFGWESIGKELVITNSEKNRVYTINNIPAAKVYEQYLGTEIYERLPATGIEFPLIIKRNSIDVARAVLVKHDDDSLTFAGNIDVGEKVQFGFGNVQKIISNRLSIAKEILEKPCEAIFVYSCMARKYLLDTSASIELHPLSQIAPISGFFTYGEIFHNSDTQKNDFLNQTLTTISISETTNIVEDIVLDDSYDEDDTQTIKALCRLVSTSSTELHDLNINLEKIIDKKTYELRVKNKELLKRFYYDELTTLGNRNLLIKEIADDPKKYSLLSIDINSFKNINDLYGVDRGDEVLKQFANLLIKIKKHHHCKVYRVSGDEFAILNKKPQDNNYTSLVDYFSKLIHEHDFFIDFNNEKIFVDINITVGIAYKSTNLIEKAHLALIQAKERHGKYNIYQSDLKLEQDIKENIKYTKIIKKAIKNDKVIVYFQPIFKDNNIEKYETLIRIDNNGEIISPFKFLEIAKKNGDYFDLTRIIIEKSFKTFSTRDEFFSINLSFEDIQNENIVKYLKDKIVEYSVQNQLIIEILEDESIKNYELIKNFIHEMQELGAKIALDDFGSGYSNFSRVLELNVDYIKIDGSIISTIDTNQNSYVIAQTITDFSKKLGIKTIAEYIHSEGVYAKAKELGINEFQGFLLGKPKPL